MLDLKRKLIKEAEDCVKKNPRLKCVSSWLSSHETMNDDTETLMVHKII
jgi:hypothetical protein